MRSVRPQAKKRPAAEVAKQLPPVMIAMIQARIPPGLRAGEEVRHAEVTALAGARYACGNARSEFVRWGSRREPSSRPTRSSRAPGHA